MRRGKGRNGGAPPPPVPLEQADALRCRGGEDPIKDIKALIDWLTGKPPDPDQWPPMII